MKSLIRRILRHKTALVIGLLRALTYGSLMLLFFGLMAINNWPLTTLSRTLATTLLTYGAMAVVMDAVYGGYAVGRKKSKPVISSMSLSTIVTDAVTYLQLQIMNVNPNNNVRLELFGSDFLWLMLCMVLQIALIVFWVRLGNDVFFRMNPPRHCLIVLGQRDECEPLEKKIGRYRLQWRITGHVMWNDPDIIERIRDSEVVFMGGEVPEQGKMRLLQVCYDLHRDVMCKAQLQDIMLSNAKQAIVDDAPFLEMEYRKMTIGQRLAKRLMDVGVSGLVLLVLSPALAVIALCIRMEDGGPALFRQKRMSVNGRVFTILKFRTMSVTASQASHQVSAAREDSRITRVGRFLRRTRLDELPQLWNILVGDMTLVGPRPEMLENVEKYKQELPAFVYREKMKAGLTGYAQIEGRYNTTPEDKLMLDLMYIESFSMWLDIKLLFRTLTVFFKSDSTEGFPADDQQSLPSSINAPASGETGGDTMKTTLLIMAAGLGSRYGGNKQIDHIGPNGEILLEYSIYDAVAAGFDKVVFVIKRSMADTFRTLIGDKIAKRVEVHYAYQEYDSLPGGFTAPEGRTKPYGTVHAVLCARELIHEPFAVINADDYYGKDAFRAMADSLHRMQGKDNAASMVAYYLKNTVSENGHVTRGVCETDAAGNLVKVTETYKIMPMPDGTIRDLATSSEGVVLDPDALVSMNFWGFTPWFFGVAETALSSFLAGEGDPMTMEYPLPVLVDTLMHQEHLVVEVLSTHAVWFGVTYREDKAYVAAELQKLHDDGAYPEVL